MLVAVGSHLEDDASLVAATHVCHLWRTVFLSSSRLWSHLDFSNEERALVFLERSKSGPLSVDLKGVNDPPDTVKESLKEVTTRVTKLQAVHEDFLDELLAQSTPMLEALEITDCHWIPPKKTPHLPSLTSLVISGPHHFQFYVPHLTSFHLTRGSHEYLVHTADFLLNFLRTCPLLEVSFLDYDFHDTTHNSNELVSLPHLRSFTHTSSRDIYQLNLLNRLSLPSTCRVVLMIDVTGDFCDPWDSGILTPRDSSYLSDIRTVRIAARSRNLDVREEHTTFKIELVNSAHKTVSFDRVSYHGDHPSLFLHQGVMDILESIEVDSVETMCFDHYPVHTHHVLPNVTPGCITQGLRSFLRLKTLILVEYVITSLLGEISLCPALDTLVVYCSDFTRDPCLTDDDPLSQVRKFVESRKKAGSPLKALTLVVPFANLRQLELERLTSCVGRVEVVSGDDALYWDVDEYLEDIQRHQFNR